MNLRPTLVLLSLAARIGAQCADGSPRPCAVAFIGANVVSMQSPAVARDQTVIVRNGVIASVGPAGSTTVPAGATRIDARGKYLMPGLADYHVHFAEREDLALYLNAGVTTLAHMGGHGALIVPWRDSIRAGKMVGPTLYLGYFLNGPLGVGGPQTAATVADAREGVRTAAARGYDFIKVYNSLTEEQFLAIMDEARRVRLPVLGHAVRSIGLPRAFALGQKAVVHAEEYTYTEMQSLADSVKLPEMVRYTKAHNVALIPNLSAFDAIEHQWGKQAAVDSFFAMPEARQLSSYWVSRWKGADYVTRRGTLNRLGFLKKLTLAMHRAGVTLLLGTDSPSIPGMFAGASIHEDLRLLVEAGLTPYEALVAGTRAAGEFAERTFGSERFGIIAPGYRADLVLLAANPLDNVRNARTPLGVMARGHWIPRR